MDVIAVHGMYVTLACMINTWGLELDERIKAKLPDGHSERVFVSDPGT